MLSMRLGTVWGEGVVGEGRYEVVVMVVRPLVISWRQIEEQVILEESGRSALWKVTL